jgi:hypothetical protein
MTKDKSGHNYGRCEQVTYGSLWFSTSVMNYYTFVNRPRGTNKSIKLFYLVGELVNGAAVGST